MTPAILTAQYETSLAPQPASDPAAEIIETRRWLVAFEWLYALFKSAHIVSSTFRLADLINACIALVFSHKNTAARIFAFLDAKLVLRTPHSPRRHKSAWMPQYILPQEVQCSATIKHSHLEFLLNQLTTACVALCRQVELTGNLVPRQARINTAERITRKPAPSLELTLS